MNIGYFNVHCNSIGDTIANAKLYFAINKYSNEKNIKTVAILHIIDFDEFFIKRSININPLNSIHTPFLNFQKKAGLINDFTFIHGIDGVNINKKTNDEIVKNVIKMFFAKKNIKIERILDSHRFHEIYNNINQDEIIDFYTKQFNFLEQKTPENYGIIQYCSFHYNKQNTDQYKKCYKRISFENIKKWINETNLKIYKFIGSEEDENESSMIIKKLNEIYKNIKFINLCGETLIEEVFQEIYNSKNVLSTESFVGLVGGIFNKSSKLYFTHNNTKVMEDFKNHMKIFDQLIIERDEILNQND